MTEKDLFDIIAGMPEAKPLIYRLYHDATGRPLFYSMEDLPGTYIEIDQETFTRSAGNVKVCNGQLITVTWQTTSKLTPSDSGTLCHANDVALIVTKGGQHWSRRTYDSQERAL